jgi:hypothetical protein
LRSKGGRHSLYKRAIRGSILLLASLLLGSLVLPAAAMAEAHERDLLIVNKQTNELAYYREGELVRTFPVATGKTDDLTPEGTFKIVNKIKNRPYYKEKIPGGDPRNPLGDRWLGLEVGETYGTTYAIHGNNNPDSIGKYVSAGCIRMHNDDIHWLFGQVAKQTTVIITNSSLSFDEIAANHGYAILTSFEGILVLNGSEQRLKKELMVVDSRVYIPMRECFELLGAVVHWNADEGTVTAVNGNRIITHQPLARTAVVDGTVIEMTPSRVMNQSVMIPLRDMAVLSGYSVEWDNDTKAIHLTRAGAVE